MSMRTTQTFKPTELGVDEKTAEVMGISDVEITTVVRILGIESRPNGDFAVTVDHISDGGRKFAMEEVVFPKDGRPPVPEEDIFEPVVDAEGVPTGEEVLVVRKGAIEPGLPPVMQLLNSSLSSPGTPLTFRDLLALVRANVYQLLKGSVPEWANSEEV